MANFMPEHRLERGFEVVSGHIGFLRGREKAARRRLGRLGDGRANYLIEIRQVIRQSRAWRSAITVVAGIIFR